MKIFRNISLLLAGLLLSQAVAAQTVLTGTVKDASSQAPLIGANVYVLNSVNRTVGGAVVDATGQYRLTIPAGSEDNLSVVFSFVGYKTETIGYTSQRSINMVLEPEAKMLDRVVVTAEREPINALGITQKESTAATQTITLERLESAPVTNIVEALQGAMANVDILTGADPGAKSTIRIRGTSSFNANQEPLIVLDGVPFPVDITDDFNFATANSDDYGQLLNISPNDIESITALKDAAATAIWGSRGASGVLEIVTKKGQQGRMSIRVSTKYEFRKEASSIPLLNGGQYRSMVQDALWNSFNDAGFASGATYAQLLFDTKEINYDPNWTYFNEYNQNTDWADEVTKTGHNTDSSVAISGGGEKTTYYLSFTYTTEAGTTIGTDFNRLSVKFNMSYKFSNKFSINAIYDFTQGNRQEPYSESGLPSARSASFNKMPNQSPYALDANGNRTGDYFTPYSNFQGSFSANKSYINPVALVHESVNETKQTSNRVTFKARYDFMPGLYYEGILGLNISGNKSRAFLPQVVTGVTWLDENFNKSTDNSSDTFQLTTDNKLTFRRTFNEDHTLVPSITFRTTDQKNSSYASTVGGNASGSMIDPVSGGKIISMGSGFSQTRSINANLNVFYEYRRKYAVNVGVNMEANSALAPDSRVGYFPTVSGTWHFGDENWFESIRNVFYTGKIRASWGMSGSTPKGSAAYVGTYKAITPGYLGMSAIQPSSIQMDNLEYEKKTSINLGIDLEFLEGKLKTSLDLYHEKKTDLLQDKVTIPSSTGYSQVAYINSGELVNKGWDLQVNYDVIRNNDWTFNVNFNVSQNQNEIKDLPPFKLDTDYTFGNTNYASKVMIGNPIGSFYGYKYQGVYQNVEDTYLKDAGGNVVYTFGGNPIIMQNNNQTVYPGDAKYQDTNGDGVIDQYDIVYLGNSQPKTLGGLILDLRYKSWGLAASLHGRFGQKVVNQVRMNNENMYGKDNQSTKVLERWRSEGDQTDIPRALYGRGYNYLGSDRFVEDASFFRLKTVTLKYNVPKNVLERWKLAQFQVYVTVYNLWTITDYTGQDPEVSTPGGYFPVAYDKAMTPQPVRFAAGLSLTF